MRKIRKTGQGFPARFLDTFLRRLPFFNCPWKKAKLQVWFYGLPDITSLTECSTLFHG